ncbi:hypothetical protein [Streptomyces shenzhenensis]|uniref:hypothetical protein n=1 Tax=Streptomyces shenzhenensis TaxID=943815 RepID=UPI0036B7EC1A
MHAELDNQGTARTTPSVLIPLAPGLAGELVGAELCASARWCGRWNDKPSSGPGR